MPLFIVAILCCIICIVGTWYFRSSNKYYRMQQANWFFHEAFTVPDSMLKFVAFQQAMGWAGEKDYKIITLVFDDLHEAGLI